MSAWLATWSTLAATLMNFAEFSRAFGKILAGQTWQRKSPQAFLSLRNDGQSWEAMALTVCAMIFPDAFRIWVVHDTHKLGMSVEGLRRIKSNCAKCANILNQECSMYFTSSVYIYNYIYICLCFSASLDLYLYLQIWYICISRYIY